MRKLFALSSKIFGIEDGWKQLIDVLLEVFNIGWKSADEGVVDESKISEQIVTNNDLFLCLELLGDGFELTSKLLNEVSIWHFVALSVEPKWVDVNQITSS